MPAKYRLLISLLSVALSCGLFYLLGLYRMPMRVLGAYYQDVALAFLLIFVVLAGAFYVISTWLIQGRMRQTQDTRPSEISDQPENGQSAGFKPQAYGIEYEGWRDVHVGFGGDGLTIGGVKIWGERWRPTGHKVIQLPHPAYPDQRHYFDIYEVGDTKKPVLFAAGELSPGVWGFYVLI